MEDWDKLTLLMQLLKNTKSDKLRLSRIVLSGGILDALFAVHKDMRSQKVGIMALGKGVAQVVSTKQKTHTRSSTEAELNSFDDITSQVLWKMLLLNEQGYHVKVNVIYVDKQACNEVGDKKNLTF